MAKFVFRMQNILNLKEKMEEQQKTQFRNANAVLNEEIEKLEDLSMRQKKFEQDLKESQTGQMNIIDIRTNKRAIDIMKTKIRDQLFVIQKAQKKVEEEREKLDEAIKERKIQEKLKEHAFEGFKKEIAAQESKEIDQLVSFTHGR